MTSWLIDWLRKIGRRIHYAGERYQLTLALFILRTPKSGEGAIARGQDDLAGRQFEDRQELRAARGWSISR